MDERYHIERFERTGDRMAVLARPMNVMEEHPGLPSRPAQPDKPLEPAPETVSTLWRRVLAGPSTSLGRWSLAFLGLFLGLECAFCIYALHCCFLSAPDWIVFVWTFADLALALAGLVAGLRAIVIWRERSVLMVLPILVAPAWMALRLIGLAMPSPINRF